jgi:tetratricopeptide (TPR) repeat protein
VLTISTRKTQIALDYAYRRCHDDPACSVFWVHADSETSFAQDYKSIARKLRLPERLSGNDLLMGVRAGIEANRCWLLVIDNADNLQLFGVQNAPRAGDQGQTKGTTLNLAEFIPRGPVGTVLWASRDKRIGSLVGVQGAIEVDRMTDNEAMELLKTVGGIDDGELDGAAELLAELGYHALALSQAAAFMRMLSITIREYLLRLASREGRRRVLQESAHDPHRRQGLTNSIMKTWDVSMKQIRQESKITFHILHMLAFLDNQNIPFDIIYHAVTLWNGRVTNGDERDKGDKNDNREQALRAAARLQEFSFLHLRASEDKGRAYEMHKLVQEAALYSLTNKDRRKHQVRYSRLALRVLNDLFPAPEIWEECTKYAVHARRAAEWSVLCGEETKASALLFDVAAYLGNYAMWNEMEPTIKMAYKLGAKKRDRNSTNMIVSMSLLAVAYLGQGRYKEAEKNCAEALALRRDIFGRRHPDTVRTIPILTSIYYVQGRIDEAHKLHVKALTLHRDIFGKSHHFTIRCMESLVGIYKTQGRTDKANKLQVKVLALYRDNLGRRHPQTMRCMARLARFCHNQGRHEEAEEIQVECLALQRDVLGERHYDTINTMANLARTYHAQKRYEEAGEIQVECLALQRDALGERHYDTIDTMADLAGTYHAQKRYQEAAEIQVECLALQRDVFGERHYRTIDTMGDLSTTYYAQKRYVEAAEIQVECLALQRDVFGERHPETLHAMMSLSITQYRLQRTHEAVAMMKDCSALFHEIMGADHLATRTCLKLLKSWERKRGK